MFIPDTGAFDITNIPLLEALGKIGKSVIISTGMADYEDIDLCLKLRTNNWDLMVCSNSYVGHKGGKSRFKSKMNTNVPLSRKLLFSKWGDDLNKYNLK